MISIKQLLEIKHCEEIFVNNIDETKKLYKQLAKIYHPDVNKDVEAEKAFRHLQELYAEAKRKLEKGIWEVKNLLTLETTLGKKISFKYLTEKKFELGMIYVGKKHILYKIEEKHKKYFDNAIKMINSINYADNNMKNEFQKLIPNIVSTYQSKADNSYLMVIKKDENEFMLSSITNSIPEKLTDRHVAWIVSRLNNLNCFLSFNNIVLNGINVDNCFINPETHSLSIYGGWWYARKEKDKMIGTTSEIFSVMPIKNKTEKIALHSTDMESIRLLARQILYNKNKTPKAFTDWLNSGSTEHAFKEFENWNKTLDQAYGKRTFVKLYISSKDIY